jgi:hypothetical protein
LKTAVVECIEFREACVKKKIIFPKIIFPAACRMISAQKNCACSRRAIFHRIHSILLRAHIPYGAQITAPTLAISVSAHCFAWRSRCGSRCAVPSSPRLISLFTHQLGAVDPLSSRLSARIAAIVFFISS